MTTLAPERAENKSESRSPLEATCPKCHTTTPWGTSSWCPDCGYYPGVTEAVPESAKPVPEATTPNVPATVERPPILPVWVVQSIAFPTIVIVGSIATRIYFTYYSGNRGLVSLILFFVGGLAALAAHLRTSFAAINETSDLSLSDILASPIEMWRPTIRGLPETGHRVVMGVTGATAVLCALVVIGGLDFGELLEKEKIKEDKNKPGIVAQVMAAGIPEKTDEPEKESGGLKDIEKTRADLEAAMDAELASQLPSPEEPLSCVVYGYMKDGKEDFGRLLLAAKINGKPVHVGVIRGDDLPAHARRNLAVQMAKMVSQKPVVAPKYHGTWVRPRIRLPISFTGWSISGELMNPEIDRGKPKEEE